MYVCVILETEHKILRVLVLLLRYAQSLILTMPVLQVFKKIFFSDGVFLCSSGKPLTQAGLEFVGNPVA